MARRRDRPSVPRASASDSTRARVGDGRARLALSRSSRAGSTGCGRVRLGSRLCISGMFDGPIEVERENGLLMLTID